MTLMTSSCESTLEKEKEGTVDNYLITGHTYSWMRRFKVDERIEKAAKHGYFEGFFLGGDILSETLLNEKNINYVSETFNITSRKTHIAMGNHDARNGNIQYFNKKRNRENTYYVDHHKGLTVLVLDTTLEPLDCHNLNRQYKMLEEVCDTVSPKSNLILLMHDAIWENIPGLPHPKKYANGTQTHWNTNCNSSTNYFHNTIYKELIKVKEKGTRVLCIMGDTGWNKGGHFYSKDSIEFIASGINNTYYMKNKPERLSKIKKDRVYILNHTIKDNTFSIEEVILNDLETKLKGS